MKKQQLLLISIGLVIGILIYAAPHLPTKSEDAVKEQTLNQKINKAIELVNTGGQPMQGIGLLREVLEEDPNNVRAHMQLGIFSITSGQYEKALERFNKVKALEPENFDADYYLGHTYANLGDRAAALNHFIAFQQNTSDAEMKKEVTQYINDLKN